MLAFAVDHPSPATIILIAGDRDYAYAVSTLKLRKYQIILVVPSPNTSPSLESQASLVIDWGAAVLRTRTEAVDSMQAVRQPYLDIDPDLVTKLLKELQALPPDDPDAALHPYSESASKLRRITARDLLEPSGHSKNTGSFDFTEESTHTPASPRKSTSTGSDPAPGELPIPKTPSRSRDASVSTGSTRARSATVFAQSPPVVEQDSPARNPPPSSATRSSASDLRDVVGPAKRSPSVLPSLDAFKLPLHDNRPPSSIVVRSPFEPGQPTDGVPVSGRPGTPSYQRLNCLASPFVMPKAPTGLAPIPNPSIKQTHITVRPTSPAVAPMKTLSETATSVCQTPRINGIGVPKEFERLTSLPIEDNDTNFESSVPHRVHLKEGAHDATYTPRSNPHSRVAPHATYSPQSRNVGLHFSGAPSSKHVPPPAAILGVGGDVYSSQFAAFPRASSALGSESVLSSSAFPSTPSTTTESHEHDESERCQAWTRFKPLVHLLLAARESGITRPSRSTIAVSLVQSDGQVYERAGVSRFRDYTALAEQAGIIELGGSAGDAWIALHPNWFGVDGITSTHSLSNRVRPLTPDPPKAIQSPLLMGSKAPLIERTAIFQTPTFTSPQPNSPEYSKTHQTSSADRQNSVPRASIPAQFQPLIDVLIRMRAEGTYPTLRSAVGQLLGQEVYTRAGVSGFKEYVHQASEAQIVQFGGVGGHAWIRLHPELRI